MTERKEGEKERERERERGKKCFHNLKRKLEEEKSGGKNVPNSSKRLQIEMIGDEA